MQEKRLEKQAHQVWIKEVEEKAKQFKEEKEKLEVDKKQKEV